MNLTANIFKGKRVTVMGLGLFGGGVGVTRWLHKSGAKITVTDIRKPSELQESLQALADLKGISYHLGGHRTKDFTKADLVVVNPAVPPDSPYLALAKKNRVRLETESNLFFQLCLAPIIGVTGSNGKTTTAYLIAEMLKGTKRKIWLGGNVGKDSLLEKTDRIGRNNIVVLELSSFQLEDLSRIRKSPHISVVTNISINHLDRHKTMRNYINAKKSILRHQAKSDYAVLNLDDWEVRQWVKESDGKILYFSRRKHSYGGVFIHNNKFYISANGSRRAICDTSDTRLLGNFNRENISAALAAAGIFNIPTAHLAQVIRTFPGVEHRLEFVAEVNNVRYYNDSIATNPVSTIGAINAVSGNLHLILGGYDKLLPFDELAKTIIRSHRRVKSVILIGATADKIESALLKYGSGCLQDNTVILKAGYLLETVLLAKRIAKTGDTVLLSPACASFDMFRNFAERGALFKKIVKSL
ncbi:MAG: UDP-N-acetylmuramoyl-L-alanine--D-glutamate ligase [Planctomycetes bacterium]|nr:UDP-N-acetylmuramoyl-L-alanine--D-glutamate ligase [Planctomycetota bacterium]